MRLIGLHVRLIDEPAAVLHKAERLGLPIFQTFLTRQATGKLAFFSGDELVQFAHKAGALARERYFHVSYHANACEPFGIEVLHREFSLAKKLGFTHAVMHPGSGKWCGNKEQAVAVLVRALDEVARAEYGIQVVLENSAHGALSVGGDLHDFALILDKVAQPEKIKFCIDTAHAYVFGYDLADAAEQEKFIHLLGQTVGFERVGLLHLNDTTKKLGSYLDQHAVIGRGNIGSEALLRFARHDALKKVPIILEFPVLDEEEEKKIYESVRGDLS